MGLVRSAFPFLGMISTESIDVGVSTFSKAAMTKGMSNFVFVVYCNALVTFLLLPIVLCRWKRTPCTFSIFCRLFLLGLIGSVAQILFFAGVRYSSPTLSSAIGNLIPLFTFLLAITCRMEKLNFRSSTGLAISLGTLVSVSGALIVTLYKGPQILTASSFSHLPHGSFHKQRSNWVFGGLLLAISRMLSAILNILMAATTQKFPEKFVILFSCCFFSCIFSGTFTFFAEREPNAWKLSPGIEMITILYSAIFGGVYGTSVHIWCLQEKGPIYVAMFKPLGMVIAVLMGVVFLGESLHVGSVIGGVTVALGFYAVMRGKAKEKLQIVENGVDGLGSHLHKTPLLQNSPVVEET